MERRAPDARRYRSSRSGPENPALAEATVEVVRPGDSVRISNVLDVVPAYRRAGTTRASTGWPASPSSACATGSAPATTVPTSFPTRSSTWPAPEPTAAPGARPRTSSSGACPRRGPPSPMPTGPCGAPPPRSRVTLAEATAGATPDDVRVIGPMPPADVALPAVAAILQVASEGPLVDTFLDGAPLGVFEPRILDERVVYGGRLTNGAYDWPAVRNVTAVYQDLALLRVPPRGARRAAAVRRTDPRARLPRRRRTEAAGRRCVAPRSPPSSAPTARSARRSRAGNSHTDTMLTVQACERLGIRTVALVCETNGGLTDHVPEADASSASGTRTSSSRPGRPNAWSAAASGARGRRARVRAVRTTSARLARRATWTAVRRRLPHEGRPLPEPVLRRPGRRGGRRPRARADRGPAGPGRGLAAPGSTIDVTLACGDDYFGEHEDERSPSCSAGSTSCARRARLRPVVRIRPLRLRVRGAGARGGSPRHPGRLRRWLPTARVCSRPRAPRTSCRPARTSPGMREALPGSRPRSRRGSAAGEELGAPEDEGYLPRGPAPQRPRRPHRCRARDRPAARQARRRRRAPRSRRAAIAFRRRRRSSISPRRRLALVTEAGCVPQGNPDRLADPITRNVWLRYPLAGEAHAGARRATNPCTRGFDTAAANADPNRLVPLDAARELEREGTDRRRCTTRSTRRRASTRPSPRRAQVRAGDRGRAEGGRGRGRDPDRHLRDRHALRGNAGEGDRTRRASRRCS